MPRIDKHDAEAWRGVFVQAVRLNFACVDRRRSSLKVAPTLSARLYAYDRLTAAATRPTANGNVADVVQRGRRLYDYRRLRAAILAASAAAAAATSAAAATRRVGASLANLHDENCERERKTRHRRFSG